MTELQKLNQLVLFELEDDIYGIDIMKTDEIIKAKSLRKIPNSPYYFEGMLNLRNEIIPIINIKKLFNFDYFDLTIEKDIIIIMLEDQKFGITIDRVIRVSQIDSNEIQEAPSGLKKEIEKFVFGITKIEDQFISILDIESVFSQEENEYFQGFNFNRQIFSFTLEMLKNISKKDEDAIVKTMKSAGIKQNIISWQGTQHYILDQAKKLNKPIQSITNQIQEEIKKPEDYLYHPFVLKKKKVLFDNLYDYYILKDVILEHLVVYKKELKDKRIKILNLTEDEGYELYSILILLKNFLPEYENWDIETYYCSKKNEETMKETVNGILTDNNLKRIKKVDREEHFRKKENNYRLNEDLMNKVKLIEFSESNLKKLENIDLIFARNFFLEFDNNEFLSILNILIKILINNGTLILSEIEDLTSLDKYLLAREINRRRYFIKIS